MDFNDDFYFWRLIDDTYVSIGTVAIKIKKHYRFKCRCLDYI